MRSLKRRMALIPVQGAGVLDGYMELFRWGALGVRESGPTIRACWEPGASVGRVVGRGAPAHGPGSQEVGEH